MNYPNNLSKYSGTIIKQRLKYIFKVVKNKKNIETIEYPFIDETTREVAEENIIQSKKDWSIKNNQVKNKYQINNNIIKVYLDDVNTFTTDLNLLSKVDEYNWYLLDGHVGTMIKKNVDDDDSNKKKLKRYKLYFYHHVTNNVTTNYKNVVHKDSDKMNNCLENLLITSDDDVSKIQHFNHKRRKDNTSGCTGVYKGKYKNKEYWEVKGIEFNGCHIYKKYSVDKYGDNGAYAMACNFRDNFINKSYQIEST